MAAALDGLSLGTTVSVVRAFSYFLHLANIAEDRHHVRRNRAHTRAGSPPRKGCLARTLERLAGAGIDGARLEACPEAALVSPVLTAHPTESSASASSPCSGSSPRCSTGATGSN